MSGENAIDEKYKNAFPGAAGDKSKDFVDAISEMNFGARDSPEEIPPLFPQPDRIQDRPIGEEAPDPDRNMLKPKDLTAKYARFDMAEPDDIRRLEQINNRILKEGWIMAREEWVHTKDGSTFVLVKYLESHHKKAKPDDASDATAEATTNPDGSKSAPVT